MGWNYRVVRRVCSHEDVLEIKEVYYDDEGNINGYGDAPVPYGESVEDIRECMKLMSRALDKPVLDESDLIR